MKLNNKGQSLVLFIVFIPVFLGIMALVIDVGLSLSKKNEIDNVLEYSLKHYLKDEEVFLKENIKEELKELIDYNLKDITTSVIIENNIITLKANTYVEGIFSNILDIKGFKIESEYIGYVENEKRIGEKIK